MDTQEKITLACGLPDQITQTFQIPITDFTQIPTNFLARFRWPYPICMQESGKSHMLIGDINTEITKKKQDNRTISKKSSSNETRIFRQLHSIPELGILELKVPIPSHYSIPESGILELKSQFQLHPTTLFQNQEFWNWKSQFHPIEL